MRIRHRTNYKNVYMLEPGIRNLDYIEMKFRMPSLPWIILNTWSPKPGTVRRKWCLYKFAISKNILSYSNDASFCNRELLSLFLPMVSIRARLFGIVDNGGSKTHLTTLMCIQNCWSHSKQWVNAGDAPLTVPGDHRFKRGGSVSRWKACDAFFRPNVITRNSNSLKVVITPAYSMLWGDSTLQRYYHPAVYTKIQQISKNEIFF